MGSEVSMPALRNRAPARAAALPAVPDFDAVAGAEVIDVDTSAEPVAAPRSRTVQPSVHPNLAPVDAKLAPRARVAVVPEGRLATSSGAVISRQGELVLETLWDEPHRRREFDPPPQLPPPRRIDGRHASLISVWCHNYHHWLFEALPRLAVLRASGIEFDRVIVPERLAPFQRATLALVGIDERSLLPYSGEHLVVDELVWASPPAPFERPTQFVIDWLRESVAGPEPVVVEPTRRLYLKRTGGRRISNEAKLMKELTPLGFEAVMPETLPFADQVALFRSSAVVVGAHGAGFSTGVFSPRLSALELYHSGLINASTLAALAAAGHEHWSLICKRVPGLHRPRHWDLRAPVGLVLESLSEMGVSR
jgi:capsular polysaccharide biosynthesis protein